MARIEEELKTVFRNDKQRLIANLVFTASWFNNVVNDTLKPFGLSLQQQNILHILKGAGDWLPMSEVKSRMVDKSPNATRLADKLLDKKLIERKRSTSDRRIVYVKISKAGLALLTQIDTSGDDRVLKIVGRIDEKLAGKMSDMLDQMRE